MPSLRRTRDGAGDSGPMSMLLRANPDVEGGVEYKHCARPEVGWAIRVGSLTGRTYAAQDWWQTTYITEILEDDVLEQTHTYTDAGREHTITETIEYVRFKTGNSEYEWTEIRSTREHV